MSLHLPPPADPARFAALTGVMQGAWTNNAKDPVGHVLGLLKSQRASLVKSATNANVATAAQAKAGIGAIDSYLASIGGSPGVERNAASTSSSTSSKTFLVAGALAVLAAIAVALRRR